MERLRDSNLCLDSPSKHSYVGSFHMPPDKMPHKLCTTSVPLHRDETVTSWKEINSQTCATAPDAGSRAVIVALKTLQEKIRRLELERMQAERNATRFSQVAHRYAGAHSELQPTSQDGKSSPRKDLVSQLHTTEARCSLLEKQLKYMRKMVESAERERLTSVGQEECVQQSERAHSDPQIKAQLQKLDKLEKECLKLTSTQSVAERKIELLEQKLLEEEHERKLVQEKAEELQRELEANLLTLSAAEVKPKKKKTKEKALSKKSLRTEVPVSQCLPKSKRMPFVAGTSTSPSHSVSANVQSVLHLLKTRQPRPCERPCSTHFSVSKGRQAPRRAPSPPTPGATALGSLSELLLALQDELGHMSFEHQELVKQIDETDEHKLREDLERELDCLVRRMEEKATQISKLRKHQQTVQKLSQCSPGQKQRPRCAANMDGRGVSGVRGLPPSPAKAPSSSQAKALPSSASKQRTTTQERIQLLRDSQRLRSSLRQQDISWET
ncbi:centrosomal protein CEP57L1 isoform X3 [Electrophorus electricus]|uniref:centrosomal protein CEP57L1 isoform X3 n=1 Tax=Electrophorus electricus TaxID=8005 RepID=UPI0015CFBED0|nr:centrosomal protein CEP57L1 isoform X3 [Electrophorus electricus]